MSHFTYVSAEIRDLDACNKALNNMGLTMQSYGSCRYYFGTEMKENVVRLPGQYDMALEKNGTGSYRITADFYGGYVERTIGPRGSILLHNYSVEMLKKVAKRLHFYVTPKGNDIYKVRDPQDTDGGHMLVTVSKDGNLTFEPKGLKGKKCAKYLQLEDSLGKIEQREFTKEYLKESAAEVKTENRQKLRVGGY